MLYGSTYMKYVAQTNSVTEAELRLPGTVRRGPWGIIAYW